MKCMDLMDALGYLESAAELLEELRECVSDDQREAIDALLDALYDDDEVEELK